MTYPIHFIGAGPGDPELITVKGKRLLEEADLVVYTGSLVPSTLVANLKAEVYDSASLTLDEVLELLTTAFTAGKKVVRLHTGDPAIYGAINEQISALSKKEIPCRVIPGVSSANATAAALCTELTLPEISQTVIITRRAGRTPVPERERLPLLAAHQATMLILLSITMIEDVVKDLLEGGYSSETPVAIVEKVSWPEERQIRGTLADIADKVSKAGIRKTAIIAVGAVLAQAPPPVLSKLYDKHFTHEYRRGIDGE